MSKETTFGKIDFGTKFEVEGVLFQKFSVKSAKNISSGKYSYFNSEKKVITE